ncbi:hypothetical protein OPHB3_2636 [Oceanobacillus picturae]|uniref:Helicase ATP-binding domain-containing protein n=1 Tax=Oceanobacillus picturae TaxID=171693 RepID=A0A0U9H7Q1_9BACI|nr:hypothetical protein [Oceanobacillus picturae]GAQ18695.1 hypothetical protein OPHB3_2636 [Oceanobacillus picturae]
MIRFINVGQKHSDNLNENGINHQFAFGQITVNVNLSPQDRVNEVLVDMLKYLAGLQINFSNTQLVTKKASLINNNINIGKAKNVTSPKIVASSFTMKATTSYLLKAHETNARQQFNRLSTRHQLHKYGILPAITIERPLPKYADDVALHDGVYFNFSKHCETRKIKIERSRPYQNTLESIRDCDEQIKYFFENIKKLTDLQLLWFMTNIIDYKSAAATINKLKRNDERITVFYKISKDMYPEPLSYSKIIGDGNFRFDYIYQAVDSPLTKTIQIAPSLQSIEHNKIGKKLEEIFKNCLADPIKRIHLIRLDTGTGKTTIALKYMNHNMAYIAPTHRLLLQSIEDLKRLNPDLLKHIIYIPQITDEELPDCELKKELLKARKLNTAKKAKQLQKEIIKIHGSPELKEKYRLYKESLQKKEGIPFITHQRFAMTRMFMNNYQNVDTFLIDEDPTKIIFPSIEHVDEFIISELKRLIDFCTNRYKLKFNSKDVKIQKKVEFVSAIGKLIKIIESNKTISTNISEKFFKSSLNIIQEVSTRMMETKNPQRVDFESILTCRFMVKKQHGRATKFYRDNTEFFRNKKIIVMSATIDEDVHVPLFAKQINPYLNWHEVGRTKNVGHVHCYTDFSTTKSALKSNPEYVDQINKTIKSLEIDNVITYKDYKDLFPFKTKQMHFYNSAGYNDLSGKNIAVIGTPNTQIEEVAAFGYLITGKLPESYVGEKLVLKSQAVIKGEFKFSFYTFSDKKDEPYINVHLWSTYNELLQATGRARTVHHDCNVYVFSRLPVPQCQIKNYSEVI